MTEADWLTCNDPNPMLHFLNGRASHRKLRLFAAGCCRRIWTRLDVRGRKAVEVAEQFADGRIRPGELEAVHASVWGRKRDLWAVIGVTTTDPAEGARGASLAACSAAQRSTRVSNRQAAYLAERAAQGDLLRDIFGPLPFHLLPSLDPTLLAWNDGCVVKLATCLYEERDFIPERMGILADALEEAGVTNEDMIRHCRERAVHVRGCWLVDLILGKE
jgi:hypothetical protein